MNEAKAETKTGRFDVMALAAELPETAKTMLADTYLTDREASSARVFRVYRAVPRTITRRATSTSTASRGAVRSG